MQSASVRVLSFAFKYQAIRKHEPADRTKKGQSLLRVKCCLKDR
jgi:hypothetical protein